MTIIGVLLATVCTQFLGVIWYSDALFRKVWMRGFGGTPVVNDNRVYMAAAAGMFSLALFFNATLGPYFGISGVHEAIHFAFILTIPVGLLQISHTGFEGRSIGAYLVNVGFDATVLVIICTIVTIL
ncbi:uncharacterized protein [Amphiura filiformis]|uniref:uncharacterized protein n=1 Tax=Amphiura filiformis TaxID=82378 RepID=UPI003B210C10